MQPQATCQECGAPLQATVVRYLSDVSLDESGHVIAHTVSNGNDDDGYAWDHPTTAVYCANDHATDWSPPSETTWLLARGFEAALLEVECIAVDLSPIRTFRVEDYDHVQRERHDQPLWARRAHPVQGLTPTPNSQGARVTDVEAYQAQMRVLIGLDEPPLSTSTATG